MGLELIEPEAHAVYSVFDVLLGEESDRRADVAHAFMSGEGEVNGIPCWLFLYLKHSN